MGYNLRLVEAIECISPEPSPKKLIRLGGNQDGAYLLPDDLEGIEACFSPGVNNFKRFEDELVKSYRIRCHLCDFSSDSDKLQTPLIESMQSFEKKWLDISCEENMITLEDWVNRRTLSDKSDLILQIDIEGAEYRNLLAASESLLRRFRIIIIEFHGLSALANDSDEDTEVGPLIRKLHTTHKCVHAHPNNCCGQFVDAASGIIAPNVIELTYLRRDRFTGNPAGYYHPQLPHPLDIRCNVESAPIMHLSEHWLRGQPRGHESTIKLLEESLGCAKSTIASLNQQIQTERLTLGRMFNKMHAPAQIASPKRDNTRTDIAHMRPFSLSSGFGKFPSQGTVRESSTFFFHTDFETNSRITIDLGSDYYSLGQLVIRNRIDGCQDRAAVMFWTIHDSAYTGSEPFSPVHVTADFLRPNGSEAVTCLNGSSGRYLTIFSPVLTALHFSGLWIHPEL